VPVDRQAEGQRLGGALRAGGPLLFLGLAFFLTLLLTRSYLVNSDEGYTLNAAWQLWNGMKMYDDFRLFVGPGSGYAIYLLWHLIGSPSFLAARLLSLAFSFSATTAIYMTLREIGVRGTGLVFAIAIWLSASSLYVPLNHNSFSTFAATWFLLLFLRVARKLDGGIGDKHRTRDHVLVGVAAGTVFIFLQTKGLLLASAGTAFVFLVGFKKRDFRPALALMGGLTHDQSAHHGRPEASSFSANCTNRRASVWWSVAMTFAARKLCWTATASSTAARSGQKVATEDMSRPMPAATAGSMLYRSGSPRFRTPTSVLAWYQPLNGAHG